MDDELLILRDAVRKIREMERPLITIDGPCASGKTTLASRLAEMLDAAVIHTDDFVIPHASKTEERLAVPGGNCDSGRLYREVCAPWRAGLPVLFSRYDCRGDRMLSPEALPECRALILEGSYCNVPVLRESADVRFFLATAPETREADVPEALDSAGGCLLRRLRPAGRGLHRAQGSRFLEGGRSFCYNRLNGKPPIS